MNREDDGRPSGWPETSWSVEVLLAPVHVRDIARYHTRLAEASTAAHNLVAAVEDILRLDRSYRFRDQTYY